MSPRHRYSSYVRPPLSSTRDLHDLSQSRDIFPALQIFGSFCAVVSFVSFGATQYNSKPPSLFSALVGALRELPLRFSNVQPPTLFAQSIRYLPYRSISEFTYRTLPPHLPSHARPGCFPAHGGQFIRQPFAGLEPRRNQRRSSETFQPRKPPSTLARASKQPTKLLFGELTDSTASILGPWKPSSVESEVVRHVGWVRCRTRN
jgi:hypothetical protein